MLPNFRYEKLVWKRGFRFVAGIDEVGRGAFAGPVVAGCVVYDKKIHTLKNKPLRLRITTKGKNRSRQENHLFLYEFNNVLIDDSKRLTSKQRVLADAWIKDNCLTWGVGESSAREIDKLGIVKATRKAMRMAVGKANQRLHNRIQYLLIDAFYIPYIRGIRMPRKSRRFASKPGKINARDSAGLSGLFSGNLIINQFNNFASGQQTAIIKGDQKSISVASASIVAKVYRDNLMTDLSKSKRFTKYHWEKNKGYGTKSHRKVIKKSGTTIYHRKSFSHNYYPSPSLEF